eukprot:gene7489-9203_t
MKHSTTGNTNTIIVDKVDEITTSIKAYRKSNDLKVEHGLVYIRGFPLGKNVTYKTIRKFFLDQNGISQIKGDGGIHFIRDGDGKRTGEAYIVFQTEEAAKEALSKNGSTMENRFIEVNLRPMRHLEIFLNTPVAQDIQSSIFWGEKDSEASKRKSPNSVTILELKGFSYNSDIPDVHKFLEGYSIKNNNIIVVFRDGKSSGDYFVEFESNEIANKALKELHKKSYGDRFIQLFKYPYSLDFNQKNNYNKKKQIDLNGKGVIYIRGIPLGTGVTYKSIRQFFDSQGKNQIIERDGVYFIRNGKGKRIGEAYIVFKTEEAAEQALLKHGSKIENRVIEVYKRPAKHLEMYLSLPAEDIENASVWGSRDQDNNLKTKKRYSEITILKLHGFAYDSEISDVREFLQGYPIKDDNILMMFRNGKFSGIVYVEFESHTIALAAVNNLQKGTYKNRFIEFFTYPYEMDFKNQTNNSFAINQANNPFRKY